MNHSILRKFLLLFFTIICNVCYGDAFLGAHLGMDAINLNGKNYRFSVTTYIDARFFPITAPQLWEIAIIWRKRDNKLMLQLYMIAPPTAPAYLSPVNPKCLEKFDIKVFQTYLTQDVFLDPAIYNDPQGYYVVFDRCCRGVDLKNMINSKDAPYTDILEFSPVNIIRSSAPKFIVPDAEYMCKGKPYKADFGAVDADGDELRYSLADPIAGYTSKAGGVSYYYDEIPRTTRPLVPYAAGYSKNDMIHGNPALSINANTGEIRITPTETGFYSITILCEEYRNGVKIGSNLRDFAINVVDCPPPTLDKPLVTSNNNPITSVDFCTGTNGLLKTDNSNLNWNFQWQKDGENILTENKESLTVSKDGDYTVIKSDKSVCTAEETSDIVKVAFKSDNAVDVKIKADKTSACENEIVVIQLESSNQTADWFLNNILIKKDKSISVTKSGDYVAKITGALNCANAKTEDKVTITINPLPTITVLPSTAGYEICPSGSASLETVQNPTYTYQWLKNSIQVVGANLHKYSTSDLGVYTVKVSTGICELVSPIYEVKIKPNCTSSSDVIYTPNAFSPNNDNLNETWQIFNIEKFPDAEVFIYNRWGELLFYSKGYTEQWNGTFGGKKVPADNYSFVIKPNFENKADIRGVIHVLY